MQRLRQVAGDQDFRIADFVTAENFWRSNRAHLVTMARVIIERNFHNFRLVLWRPVLRAKQMCLFLFDAFETDSKKCAVLPHQILTIKPTLNFDTL